MQTATVGVPLNKLSAPSRNAELMKRKKFISVDIDELPISRLAKQINGDGPPKAGFVMRTPRQRAKYTETVTGYGQHGDGFTDSLKSVAKKVSDTASKAGSYVKQTASDVASDVQSGYHGVQHIREDRGNQRFNEGILIDELRVLREEVKALEQWFDKNKILKPHVGDGYISKVVNDYANRQAEKHGAKVGQLQAEIKKMTAYRNALRAGRRAVEKSGNDSSYPQRIAQEVRYEPEDVDVAVHRMRKGKFKEPQESREVSDALKNEEWVGFGDTSRARYGMKDMNGRLAPISLKACA